VAIIFISLVYMIFLLKFEFIMLIRVRQTTQQWLDHATSHDDPMSPWEHI